jgi:hypothetical protein
VDATGPHQMLAPLISGVLRVKWNPVYRPFSKKDKLEANMNMDEDDDEEVPVLAPDQGTAAKKLAEVLGYKPGVAPVVYSETGANVLIAKWYNEYDISLTGTDTNSLKGCEKKKLRENILRRFGERKEDTFTYSQAFIRGKLLLQQCGIVLEPRLSEDSRMRIMLFHIMTAELYLKHADYFRLYHGKFNAIIKHYHDMVFCTTHTEDRVGKTLVQLLLQSTLDNKDLTAAEKTEKLKWVEEFLNTKVLRHVDEGDNVFNLKIKVEDKKVGRLALWNTATRKVLKEINDVIDYLIPEPAADAEPVHAKYVKANQVKLFSLWSDIVEGMRSDEDFSDAEIDSWQLLVDEWGRLFLALYGWRAAGDYTSALIEGRFRDQLYRHRNLHRHCQQAWEALNKLVSKFLHTQTNRGGNKGNHLKDNACAAIYRWMKRRAFRAAFPTPEAAEAYVASCFPDHHFPQPSAYAAAFVVLPDAMDVV